MNKLKGSKVLIVAAGSTLKKYRKTIKNMILEENIITVGCNGINNIVTPDYHFWGSSRRWKRFGKKTNEKSILYFPLGFDKN